MALAQTKAATYIQEHTEEISSHQVISLLMDGALERAEQAKQAFMGAQQDDLVLLLSKLIAIINGLKNSLDMRAGGEISVNLDALYEYMIQKISQADANQLITVLNEVQALLTEVKYGWDNMALEGIEFGEIMVAQ